jgi:hypothetical protein
MINISQQFWSYVVMSSPFSTKICAHRLVFSHRSHLPTSHARGRRHHTIVETWDNREAQHILSGLDITIVMMVKKIVMIIKNMYLFGSLKISDVGFKTVS